MAKSPLKDARDGLLYRPRERKPKEKKEPAPFVPTGVAQNGTIKTTAMLLVELELGVPIEQALEGSLSVVAKRTGMDFSTVSKWKKRLGLSG